MYLGMKYNACLSSLSHHLYAAVYYCYHQLYHTSSIIVLIQNNCKEQTLSTQHNCVCAYHMHHSMSDNMEYSNENNILVESAESDAADEMDVEEEDSDYVEEESDDESDWIDFDEDILRRLKDNDPTISELSLNMGTTAAENRLFDALSIDWELEGGAIAENTHLKSLSIDSLNESMEFEQRVEDATSITNAKAFFAELSKNKSV